MTRTRIHNLSISLDGFACGEGQSAEAPMGHAGHRLHEWMIATRFGAPIMGLSGGTAGLDDAFAQQHEPGIGAEIMGSNKFGPPGWQDDPEWKAGGVRTRRSTRLRSCSPTGPALRSKWLVGQPFTSSTSRPSKPWTWRVRRPAGGTYASAAVPRWPGTSSPPGWWTTFIWCRCRSCWAGASVCGTAWKAWRATTAWRRSRRQVASPISLSRDSRPSWALLSRTAQQNPTTSSIRRTSDSNHGRRFHPERWSGCT